MRPSRACIITGRNSWQLEAACNHVCLFPPKFRSYPEILAEHGYFVGHTVKGWGPGTALDDAGNPRQLTGPPFNTRKLKPPASQLSNVDYAANFAAFLDAAPADKPWCFWYGSIEPHRGYEQGVGMAKANKDPATIPHVPAFWPDTPETRSDMLDYAYEIEYFDHHLGLMLDELEKRGQLDNTLVVVTSDNGMPFPRVKGQCYEMSNHMPLAIMWQQGIKNPGRTIDDFVSFIDFAPTFLEVAGIDWTDSGMSPTPGHSLTDIFQSPASGQINPDRDHVLIGKERHDVGRPHDQGYPIRGIVEKDWLYLHNFEPDRWPAGNPETGYLNCDASPTKSTILTLHRADSTSPFWQSCFAKRPPDELYNITNDPDCLQNLAPDPSQASRLHRMQSRLFMELKSQSDPRLLGHGQIFDQYEYADKANRGFYERFMAGEELHPGWVAPTDFEPSN